MNLEDHTDFDYGNFAVYLDGKPIVYGLKHDKKYSLDIPFTSSKIFNNNVKARSFVDGLIDEALTTSGGSITFTINHANNSVKQVITNGYKRVKIQ